MVQKLKTQRFVINLILIFGITRCRKGYVGLGTKNMKMATM